MADRRPIEPGRLRLRANARQWAQRCLGHGFLHAVHSIILWHLDCIVDYIAVLWTTEIAPEVKDSKSSISWNFLDLPFLNQFFPPTKITKKVDLDTWILHKIFGCQVPKGEGVGIFGHGSDVWSLGTSVRDPGGSGPGEIPKMGSWNMLKDEIVTWFLENRYYKLNYYCLLEFQNWMLHVWIAISHVSKSENW